MTNQEGSSAESDRGNWAAGESPSRECHANPKSLILATFQVAMLPGCEVTAVAQMTHGELPTTSDQAYLDAIGTVV